MDLGKLPDDALGRLDLYRSEREKEKARCEEIQAKRERGEPLTETDEVFWAHSIYGSATRHGY